MSGAAAASVILERLGPCGLATLNRPKALNALNKSMIETLSTAFKEWGAEDNDVSCIIVKGGEKAFCAGGDVKTIVLEGLVGNYSASEEFFRDEYRLNFLISELKKPYVSLMDGIIMGGGCGLAMHGSFRVATERTSVAMPECAIGLFPDVGASRFLNTLQNGLGKYMAITGARLTGLEAKTAGLATHYIPARDIHKIPGELAALGRTAVDMSVVDKTLKSMEEPVTVSTVDEVRKKLALLSSSFIHEDISAIIASLKQHNGDYARECHAALEAINSGSPLSVRITMKLLGMGRTQDLRSCLETEFNLARYCGQGKADFFEGVRAMLIDKDKKPQWKHKTVWEVPESAVEECFLPGSNALLPFQIQTKL